MTKTHDYPMVHHKLDRFQRAISPPQRDRCECRNVFGVEIFCPELCETYQFWCYPHTVEKFNLGNRSMGVRYAPSCIGYVLTSGMLFFVRMRSPQGLPLPSLSLEPLASPGNENMNIAGTGKNQFVLGANYWHYTKMNVRSRK